LRPHRFVPRLEILEGRLAPAVLTVNTLADETAADNFLSLREAIGVVDSGSTAGLSAAELAQISGTLGVNDTIQFASKLNGGTITLTAGELTITANLDIAGPGPNQLAISGNNASRVFEVAAGLNVSINDLTITQGYAPDQGGGILNDGSNLTLNGDDLSQNVVLESATDGGRGGAVYSLGGTLTITGCDITGNQALGAAGPYAVGDGVGGGFYVLAGNALISNSTFSGNLAQGGYNSVFASADGGALDTHAPTTITDCTFNGNSAVGGNGGTGGFVGVAYGGAVLQIGATSISGSTFVDNQAIGGSGANSGPGQLDPLLDTGFGGAITTGTALGMTVANSSFRHNLAIGGNNSTVTGIDILETGVGAGGAIDDEFGDTASVSGCTFDGNEANGGNGNTGGGPQVGLALVGIGLGGAIDSGLGGVNIGPNTLTVGNSTLKKNIASGGANNSGTATVAGFVGSGIGAGIANYLGSSAQVTFTTLSSNRAVGGTGNSGGGGGAVFFDLGAGGGIFNYLGNFNSSGYGQLNASVVTITNSTLDHNQAVGDDGGDGYGGGLANLLSATATLTGTELSHNLAQGGDDGGNGYGGGLYNDATSTLTLQSCTVTHNDADGGDDGAGIGGGVYNLGAFTYDVATIIKHNHASTSGDDIGP
jgi:hypothetical protein